MKNADKSAVLGLLDGKQFQEKIDIALGGIKKNSLVIAKKYGELMVAARKDFDVAEKTLVAKIVTRVYNETKEIRKMIKKDNITLKDVPIRLDINIERWKELKVYGRMLDLNKYGISLADRLNESLKKYHLDETIRAHYDVPYFSGDGQMFITLQVTDPQELTV